MANKSELIASITNTLTDPEIITPEIHIDSDVHIVDNLYPRVIICNNLPTGGTNGILTPEASQIANWRYDLKVRKVGNAVFWDMKLQYLGSSFFTGSVKIATINNTEFRPDYATDGDIYLPNINSTNVRGITINPVSDNGDVVVTAVLPISSTGFLLIQGFYFTQP